MRQITPYVRGVIELFPWREDEVSVPRFLCRKRKLTVSLLPLALVPYHRYTLRSMMLALLLFHGIWGEPGATLEDIWSELPPESNVAIYLLRYWLGEVLRGLSEVTVLQVSDIDSQRMQIRVREGKGQKERYTLLTQALLQELRIYWRQARPQRWLFPGASAKVSLTADAASSVFTATKARAGIDKRGGIHMLRHYAESRIMPSRGENAAWGNGRWYSCSA